MAFTANPTVASTTPTNLGGKVLQIDLSKGAGKVDLLSAAASGLLSTTAGTALPSVLLTGPVGWPGAGKWDADSVARLSISILQSGKEDVVLNAIKALNGKDVDITLQNCSAGTALDAGVEVTTLLLHYMG